MPVGMKVAKPGFNALFALASQLSFSSQLATHSIYNVLTVNKPSGTNSYTITHNLGFVPKAWVFADDPGGGGYLYRLPRVTFGTRADFYMNTTQLVIQTDSTAAATFRVIIFTRSFIP